MEAREVPVVESTPAGMVRAPCAELNGRSIMETAFVGAAGGCIFGFTLHTITGAVIFLQREFGLDPPRLGFAVSCAMLGCVAGASTAAVLADRVGRKRTLTVAALLLVLGTGGTVYAKSIVQFDAFRTLSGLAVGIVSVVSPMYMAELSPARARGKMVTVYQLAIVISGFLSILIGYHYASSGNWRAMFASSLIPAAALLTLLPLVPESPRWLLKCGRNDEARRALARVYRDDEEVLRELEEMAGSPATLRQSGGSLRALLQPGMRKALMTGIVLAMCVQLTGISAVSWYVPIVLQRAGGQSVMHVMLYTVAVNAWQVLCSILAMFTVDRVGRRVLLLSGTLGMAVSMTLVGVLFLGPAAPAGLVLVAIMLAMGFYNFSLAPLFWLLIAEIFPTPLRAKGMAASSLVKWTAAFVSAQIFPMMTAYSALHFTTIAPVFWLFAAVCGCAFLFCYRAVPETRNRTLEEIGQAWK